MKDGVGYLTMLVLPLAIAVLPLAMAQDCKTAVGSVPCLMQSIEGRSDSGKMIFKKGDFRWNIDINFTLLTVNGLTEDGTLSARIRIETRWHDPILQWQLQEYSGMDTILMPSSLARWPNFVLLEDQDSQHTLIDKMSQFPVMLTHNGDSSMLTEVGTKTSCSMDATHFPLDSQTCRIKIALLPLQIRSIAELTVGYTHDETLFSDSTDWPLLPSYVEGFQTSAIRTGIAYDEDFEKQEKYAFLEIRVRRNGHSVEVALVDPMFAFSFLTSFIFLLPPESGERMGTAITMLLTIAVTLISVKDLLPNSSSSSFFSRFCEICFGQTIVVFLETIVVLSMWSWSRPRPGCLRSSKAAPNGNLKLHEEEKKDDNEFWQKCTRCMDGVCFVINLIVSIVAVPWTYFKIADVPQEFA